MTRPSGKVTPGCRGGGGGAGGGGSGGRCCTVRSPGAQRTRRAAAKVGDEPGRVGLGLPAGIGLRTVPCRVVPSRAGWWGRAIRPHHPIFRTIPSSPRLKSHCFVNVDVVVCPNNSRTAVCETSPRPGPRRNCDRRRTIHPAVVHGRVTYVPGSPQMSPFADSEERSRGSRGLGCRVPLVVRPCLCLGSSPIGSVYPLQWRIYGGGDIVTCSPPWTPRRPDPLSALSVQNGVIFLKAAYFMQLDLFYITKAYHN